MNDVQSYEQSDDERLSRTPNVLRAYAKDIEKHGAPLDSGLPAVLKFSAEKLGWLIKQVEGVTTMLNNAGVATSPGKGVEGYTLTQRVQHLATARDYFRKQLDGELKK